MNKITAYMNRCSLAAVTATCLGVSPMSAADMMSMEGVEPWEICALCHGATGVTTMSRFPHLAGQKPDYLKRQLENFRSGRRSNDGGQMVATAKEVSPQEIDEIVNYFSSLSAPASRSSATAGSEDLALGEAVFLNGNADIPACASCHASVSSTAPWLFGQHADYIEKQLRDFAGGARKDLAGAEMAEIAGRLTTSEMAAVSVYLEAAHNCAPLTSTVVQKTLKNKGKTTCYDRQ